MKDIGFRLSGLVIWALAGLMDNIIWSNLLRSDLGHLGALIGFAFLAILSIPATILLFIIGAYLIID